MQNYIHIEEISKELGISSRTLRKYCKDLGIVPTKITKKDKNALIKGSKETILRKAEAKELEDVVKSVKVDKSNLLVGKSGQELEIMLDLALKDFDDNQKSILACQEVINEKGTILSNGNNGTISSNPAVKTKTELLKAQSVLRKDILNIKEALAQTINYADEDNPFGDE